MVNRYSFAGLLSVLALLGIGLLLIFVTDGEGSGPSIEAQATTPPSTQAAIGPETTPEPTATAAPKVPASKLQQAADAAGCTLLDPANDGADHVTRETTAADYGSNPPTSGIHLPEWPPDGIYPPEQTPQLGYLVHTLEHGRINIQYAKGSPQTTVDALTKYVSGADKGYHLLLFENQTDMPYAVAATAWDHLIGCPEFNAKTVAAVAEFRETYIDKGPETVP